MALEIFETPLFDSLFNFGSLFGFSAVNSVSYLA
jgi:hypothetical protein